MHLPAPNNSCPCVFFDDGCPGLGPLTCLRASFEVRIGAYTTAQRLAASLDLKPVAVFVPPALAKLVATHWTVPVNTMPESVSAETVLVINGRCPLPLDVLQELEPGQAAVEKQSGDLICARLSPGDVIRLMSGEDPTRERIDIHDHVLVSRPWHTVTFRNRALAFDLAFLMTGPSHDPPGPVFQLGSESVRIDPSAVVSPGVTLDASEGPIVIERHAKVRPGATIIGPAVVGPSSVVAEQSVIRPNTAIGPVCKVGGEIAGVTFQGYANKVHDGYLGDSWVGEWVNLGAGTVSSNLLNTYSEISALAIPHGTRERTGLQFFGCVLGDHCKTAIGTRLMTGAVVGTGVMWAASEPLSGCVSDFAWVTDAGRRLTRLEKFIDVARTVMARRDRTPSQAYLELLKHRHAQANVSTG